MKNDRLNGILTALRQGDCIILIGSGIFHVVWAALLERAVGGTG